MKTPVLALLLCASGCTRFMDPAEARSLRARHTEELKIGVAWPDKPIDGFDPGIEFWRGVELGLDSLRADGGLPRPIALVQGFEDGTLARGKSLAEGFAENADLVAVIGHRQAEDAAVASVIYEFGNVVMLAAGSTSRRLNRAGFERIFRLSPNDEELGAGLADYAQGHGLVAALVIYANDEHGRAMANAFESRGEALRVSVIDRVSFEHGALAALERNLKGLEKKRIEAVVLAARLPEAAEVLALIHRAGLNVPILSGDDLDSADVAKHPDAEGLVVATAFDPTDASPETARLVKGFREKHNEPPSTWVAQGYDAIRTVGEAMIEAKSAAPEEVAKALHRDAGFKTSAGAIRFGSRGEPIGRAIRFKRVSGGRFQPEAPRAAAAR